MIAALRAGLGFGALAFVIGGLLGPLREIVLAPRIGGVAAAWAETAVFAPLLWLAAGRMVAVAGSSAAPAGRGHPPEAAQPPLRIGPAAALAMGLAALAVVLVAETALGALLQATGLATARAPRGIAELLPGWLLTGWLLVLPLLRGRG